LPQAWPPAPAVAGQGPVKSKIQVAKAQVNALFAMNKAGGGGYGGWRWIMAGRQA
jgi:hypothetical protein